ncbi:sugar phosphate isomerase/epimerase family protein [Spirosoma areae]
MQAGISTYTYPWAIGVPGYPPTYPMTAFDLLREAKRLDVQAVQFGDNLPLHVLPPADWQALLNEATRSNIQIQVGTRGLTSENLKTYIRLAWEARSPFLRIVIDDADYQPTINEIVAIISDKVPTLETAGVVLAIENHDRFTGHDLWQIALQTSLRQVGFCLDTTNSFGAGETVDNVLACLENASVVNLHVKDFLIRRVPHKMGFLIEGCEPGTGKLDLKSLLIDILDLAKKPDKRAYAVTKRDYPLVLTLEQWPPLSGTLEQTIALEAQWAEKGINWIKQIIHQVP